MWNCLGVLETLSKFSCKKAANPSPRISVMTEMMLKWPLDPEGGNRRFLILACCPFSERIASCLYSHGLEVVLSSLPFLQVCFPHLEFAQMAGEPRTMPPS